jgi:hypothetical protein
MYESHTGLRMHSIVDKVMLPLEPNYRLKVVGVSTDGASSMTCHLHGIVTYFRRLSHCTLYRFWCLSHRMGIFLGAAIKSFDDDEFGAPGGSGSSYHEFSYGSPQDRHCHTAAQQRRYLRRRIQLTCPQQRAM